MLPFTQVEQPGQMSITAVLTIPSQKLLRGSLHLLRTKTGFMSLGQNRMDYRVFLMTQPKYEFLFITATMQAQVGRRLHLAMMVLHMCRGMRGQAYHRLIRRQRLRCLTTNFIYHGATAKRQILVFFKKEQRRQNFGSRTYQITGVGVAFIN